MQGWFNPTQTQTSVSNNFLRFKKNLTPQSQLVYESQVKRDEKTNLVVVSDDNISTLKMRSQSESAFKIRPIHTSY